MMALASARPRCLSFSGPSTSGEESYDGWEDEDEEEIESFSPQVLQLDGQVTRRKFRGVRSFARRTFTPSPPIDGGKSDGLAAEDDDLELPADLEIQSPSPQPTKSKGKDNKISNKSLHDKMMALMTLQSASGHFVEDKMIGDIVGKPLEDLKAEIPDPKPETMKSWLTAVVIAFLELKCQEEKDLWGMSVEKAKTVVIDQTFVELAKEIIAQI